MKTSFTLFSLIALFVFAFNISFAQQSKAPTSTPEVMEANQHATSKLIVAPGFPAFRNTGNPEVDTQNYREAKEKWIHDNPELYKSLTSEKKGTITRIPRAKFERLSIEKQDEILKQPDKYIVE